jgi:hypothetical protein
LERTVDKPDVTITGCERRGAAGGKSALRACKTPAQSNLKL